MKPLIIALAILFSAGICWAESTHKPRVTLENFERIDMKTCNCREKYPTSLHYCPICDDPTSEQNQRKIKEKNEQLNDLEARIKKLEEKCQQD